MPSPPPAVPFIHYSKHDSLCGVSDLFAIETQPCLRCPEQNIYFSRRNTVVLPVIVIVKKGREKFKVSKLVSTMDFYSPLCFICLVPYTEPTFSTGILTRKTIMTLDLLVSSPDVLTLRDSQQLESHTQRFLKTLYLAATIYP